MLTHSILSLTHCVYPRLVNCLPDLMSVSKSAKLVNGVETILIAFYCNPIYAMLS